TLGVPPLVGRTLDAGDDAPGAAAKLVLGYAFWQRRFHGDPNVVGRTVVLDATPHTIVGVMPASFVYPFAELGGWRALPMAPASRRGPFYTRGVARLKPGVGIQQARANLEVVAAGIKQQFPGPNRWAYELVPLQESIVGHARRILYVLFAAVGFL